MWAEVAERRAGQFEPAQGYISDVLAGLAPRWHHEQSVSNVSGMKKVRVACVLTAAGSSYRHELLQLRGCQLERRRRRA